MKKFLVCLTAWAMAYAGTAQTGSRYIVQFRNKAGTPYSLGTPQSYLSQRAIDRRTRYNISIDSTDLPVTPRYLDSIRSVPNVTLLNVSRWLNSVTVQTTDATAVAKINSFSFVQSAAPIAARLANSSGGIGKKALGSGNATRPPRTASTTANFYNYGLSIDQVHIHNGEFLHNVGLRGQGMVIGMLDAGFRSYTTLKAFDSVLANGQILGTYDFVAREASVVEDDAHGMECFSIIAANIPGQFVGTAPKASFYLFRSEDAGSEYPIEEHNWVVAAERVDSAGGDVISSSLGYTTFDNSAFNHSYQDMNGNTTIAARGADLAAKKGLLVANSAGNEGDDPWHYIGTPADADSVLAVGAVRRDSVAASFTSYGPSSDGQVKPDVASIGVNTVLQTTGNTVGSGNGTSFSCPNMAGLATCLWQGFPEVNNMRIITALRQASHKFSAPDVLVGYGIPDMKKAVLALLKEYSTASVVLSSPCKHTVSWRSKDAAGMRYEVERKGSGQAAFTKIGEVQATTGSFASRNYAFIDSALSVSPGVVQYRIRQVIDTASSGFAADYIDTVSIGFTMACDVTSTPTVPANDASVILLPNPAVTIVTLKITTPNPVLNLGLRIVNAKGQVLRTERRTKPAAGTATFDVPVFQLAAGKYFISVYNGEKLLATKELLKL